ncbi:MAG: ATP-binding protein [Pseudomonadota bacterium]
MDLNIKLLILARPNDLEGFYLPALSEILCLPGQQKDGCKVIKATSVTKALQIVERSLQEGLSLDLVLIDAPENQGVGVDIAQRMQKADSGLYVGVMTDEPPMACENQNVFFIKKGVSTNELKQYVGMLISLAGLAQAQRFLVKEVCDARQRLNEMGLELERRAKDQTMASLGMLAASAAHEINNPISFIINNLSAIKKYSAKIVELLTRHQELETHVAQGNFGKLKEAMDILRCFKKEEKIDFILEDIIDLSNESLEGASRVKNIIMDLKGYARSDQTDLKYVSLNELMDNSIRMTWNDIRDKADIHKSYKDIPQVRCFSEKISQVFMNILVNAAQAIDNKGIIDISTRYLEEGRRAADKFVEVSVADNGKGISDKHLDKIFDPFFTTKPVGQGTGLGMSIAYDIIKAHGGKISVTSEEGIGTTVTVGLPIEPIF